MTAISSKTLMDSPSLTKMTRHHRSNNRPQRYKPQYINQLLVCCNAVSTVHECIQHVLNHQCSQLLHKAPVQLFLRQCTLQHPSDIISYFNTNVVPSSTDNGAWKQKVVFERVFSRHTPGFTHWHTTPVRCHFVWTQWTCLWRDYFRYDVGCEQDWAS